MALTYDYAPNQELVHADRLGPATGLNDGGMESAPDNVTELAQGIPRTVVANPATPWTSGQYVQTTEAGAAGRATWSGTTWVGGVAPLADEPEAES